MYYMSDIFPTIFGTETSISNQWGDHPVNTQHGLWFASDLARARSRLSWEAAAGFGWHPSAVKRCCDDWFQADIGSDLDLSKGLATHAFERLQGWEKAIFRFRSSETVGIAIRLLRLAETWNRSKCKGSAARLLQVSGALWFLGFLSSF